MKKAELIEKAEAMGLDVDGLNKADIEAAIAEAEAAGDGSAPPLVVPDHDDVEDDDGNVIPQHGHNAAETKAERQARLKSRG